LAGLELLARQFAIVVRVDGIKPVRPKACMRT
jgi:hypothetical protein